MTGLTLTQAINVEEVLHELELCVKNATTNGSSAITPQLRTENVAEFCETLRKVLG